MGRFFSKLDKTGVTFRRINHLNWEKSDPLKDLLFFLSPLTEINPQKLASFLNRGGQVVLADDHRLGTRIFNALGIPLMPESTVFPVAIPLQDLHPLTLNVKQLVGNHVSSFNISHTPIAGFPDSERAMIAQVTIGKGELLLLSDPSILINDMLERGDNGIFADNLAIYLRKSNRNILFLTDFTESGWPKGVSPDKKYSESLSKIIRDFLIQMYEQLSENQIGLRLLLLLFLTPFIYITVLFGTQKTLSTPLPPSHSSTNRYLKLKYRFLAVTEILREKITSDPSMKNILNGDINHLSSGTRKLLVPLLPYLGTTLNADSPFLNKLDPNIIVDLIATAEELIIILNSLNYTEDY
ncbi:MAG: hypothetical protein JXR95_12675 [Deltaproteobacteria bacterium]|nr:hypothetical protein [Deltaproteobacteria bacterium]